MMHLQVFDFFLIACMLIIIGLWGILIIRSNIIIILLSLELIFLGISLNFILFSNYLDDIVGHIFAFVLLTVAAAESAIGLALFVSYHRVSDAIAVSYLHSLRG